MPRTVTPGQLMLEKTVPKKYHSYLASPLDKSALADFTSDLTQEGPETYKKVLSGLHEIGERVSRTYGGPASIQPQSLLSSGPLAAARGELETRLQKIEGSDLSPDEKSQQLVDTLKKAREELKPLVWDAIKDTTFGVQIESGARGNLDQVMEILTGKMIAEDSEGNPLPIPITRGYAEGMTPAQYWATAHSARQGIIGTKLATPAAGDIANQIIRATTRLRVTQPNEPESKAGLPVDPTDPDYIGSILARPVSGLARRGQKITPKLARKLKDRGVDRVLIHSPITSQAPYGISREAAGSGTGELYPIGSFAGISSGQALCLSEGTSVQMANGSTKNIEDIVPGEKVLGCNKEGELQPVTVLKSVYSGKKECVRTCFRRGSGRVKRENLLELIATPDHKILSELVIRSGRRSAENLAEKGYFSHIDIRPLGTEIAWSTDYAKESGDQFCARLASSFDDSGCREEPFAFFLGLLTGDGSYTGKLNTVRLSCYDEECQKEYDLKLQKHGFYLSCSGGECNIVDKTHYSPIFRSDGSYYRNRLLEKLKTEEMWGQCSKEKTLPKTIHEWDNPSVAAYISGLFGADGGVHKSLHFGSSSKKLIKGVRQLLGIRFGVWSSSPIGVQKKREDGGLYDPYYRIQISQKRALQKLEDILTLPRKKQKALSECAYNVGQVCQYIERCSRMEIEKVGIRPTYDIYVEHKDHLFMLENGLIVSNSEPVSQISIGSKHLGQRSASGLDVLEQLISVPYHFPGAAPVAEEEGFVTEIKDLPTGGKLVKVGNEQYSVPPGSALQVKKGDRVHAGDVLSGGLPNPRDLVRLLGVGEGRRRFGELFSQVLENSGVPHNKRNVEYIARGIVNHVRMEEPWKHWLPGDLVEFSEIQRRWEPREGAETVAPRKAVGEYLEEPAAQYTVGTKITPGIAKDLQKSGMEKITVHEEAPPFVPEVRRAREALHHAEDWMTRLGGSNLKRTMLKAVQSERAAAEPDEPTSVFGQLLTRGVPEELDAGKR